jgi:riboflavin kinase/FMN adenylyltransferase
MKFHRKNTVVSIGKFDGVHTGHRSLLEEIRKAKREGLETVIFTFVPSFTTFFSKVKEDEIFSLEEKELYFEKIGIDVLIEYPLNMDTVNISADIFIQDILVGMLDVKKVVAGADVSFGKNAKGDGEMLRKVGKEFGFETILIDKVSFGGEEISSTRIRNEIRVGNMPLANQLLGDLYTIIGTVRMGKKIGRTIGFPTVNISPEQGKLLPKLGVYFSEVEIEEERYYGLTNIGKNPTISEENQVSIETHIFNFKNEIYGVKIQVYPVQFYREEIKFKDKEELKEQINKDLKIAKEYFRLN